MGNDGGSIPTRRELVKEAACNRTATEVKESQHEQQEYFWTTDPISQKPLVPPVVSDSSGKLYNKDTILEYLVEGARKEDVERITKGSVKSLRDVVEVKFEVDCAASKDVNGNSAAQEKWKCPVTGDRLGPGSKAAYIVPCGHAFSGHAIREVSGEKCIVCETEYAANDIIPILPTLETDTARLALRVKTLQEKGLSHALKKASGSGKKRKKREGGTAEAGAVEDAAGSNNDTYVVEKEAVPAKNGHLDKNAAGGIHNSSAASLTAKVLEEQEKVKRRKVDSDNVRSLFSSRDQSRPIGRSGDFMSRGFSIPTPHGR